MRSPLQQCGHADYRSTNHTGFPSARDEEPVGDPVEDVDNDEDFRQSSLDRLDLSGGPAAPKQFCKDEAPPAPEPCAGWEFEHLAHRVRMKSKPSQLFGRLYGADITRPDGSRLEWGLWFVGIGAAERAARGFVNQNA